MARPFLDERISLDVRYGTSFSCGFSVTNTSDVGGNSYSKLHNPFPVLRYELNFANCQQEQLAKELQDLYMRSGGTHGGFRVKHHTEFTTKNYTQAPTHTDQPLIDLGGNKYQLVVWYGTPGGESPRRLIRKPVSGTVKVGVGGALVTTGFAVDYVTGVITFSSAPSGAVTAGCEFDIPMRFDADLSGSFNSYQIISSNLSVLEILNP
jgi:uncharacterized protein (TIGR02217 family)